MNKTGFDTLSLNDILKNNTFLSRESIQTQLKSIEKEKTDKEKNEKKDKKFNFTSIYEENSVKYENDNYLHKYHPFNVCNMQHSRVFNFKF